MTPLRALALALLAAGSLTLAHAQGLRPEVGKPLQQASELLKAGKARDALAKVREAEAVSGKTAAEQLTVDRMKGAAAQRAGDNGVAIEAFESVFSKVSGAEQRQVAESLAFAYSQLRNWTKSMQWVDRAESLGSNSAQLKQLQSYLQAQTGDYASIARDADAAIRAAEKAGRRPDEGDLLRLADAQQRTGATSAYIGTLEKLLAHYPKKDYWAAYLGRLIRKPNFSTRFGLDVMRLKLASDTLDATEDFMEMSQLALQARLPAEGLRIIEKGFASGALGKGAEADRHNRLRELAVKRLAERKASIESEATLAATMADGNDLVEVGYAFVTFGEVERGIKLIEDGIAKGDLKRPDDAQLRLGMAQLQSKSQKAKGVKTLQRLKGHDGVAEIGRLWTVLAR